MEEVIIDNVIYCVFSLFGLVMWLNIFIKKKRYEKISGSITFVKTDYFGETSEGAHCKYEYEYKGKKYEYEDKSYESSIKSKVGDKVILYIDANNPSKILTPANIKYGKIYFVCFICGMLAVIVF